MTQELTVLDTIQKQLNEKWLSDLRRLIRNDFWEYWNKLTFHEQEQCMIKVRIRHSDIDQTRMTDIETAVKHSYSNGKALTDAVMDIYQDDYIRQCNAKFIDKVLNSEKKA